MQEYHRRITSVVKQPHAVETSTALLAGATVIPLGDLGDFTDYGGHALIDGTVYAYSDCDEGEYSGTPSITLDTGLVAGIAAETVVYECDSDGEVVVDWVATVTDEIDGSSNTAYLTHHLIALVAEGIRVVGESGVVQVDEDDGTWWLVNILGATPGYDPVFIRTGGLGADTVVWAGTENGRRAQLDGVDGALECFDDTNTQTVNLDGQDNYIEGTLATAAGGGRVEIGPGVSGFGPTNEVRLFTGSGAEVEPGILRGVNNGSSYGVSRLLSPEWSAGQSAQLELLSRNPPTISGSTEALLAADMITLAAPGISGVTVNGTLSATMRTGSVGTSTFRDSVDARVTAVGASAYRPRLLAIPAAITTATYTLATTDADLCLQFSSTSAQTVTLPTDATAAIPNGTIIHLRQINTGLLSLAAEAGATIRNPNATLNVKARYGTVIAHKTAANIWTVWGDLA